MNTATHLLVISGLAVMFATGCGHRKSASKTERGAATGAAAGAIVGGVIGNNSGAGTAKGAAIGAAAGGLAGAAVGHQQEQREAAAVPRESVPVYSAPASADAPLIVQSPPLIP